MDQTAAGQAAQRRNRNMLAITLALFGGALAGALLLGGVWLFMDRDSSTQASGAGGEPPSVEELMAAAGCEGELIAPQLFTREVGRCTIADQEVDVAAFDDNEKRDEWVTFVEDIGSTVVVGDRWAVSGFGAAGPEAFAEAMK